MNAKDGKRLDSPSLAHPSHPRRLPNDVDMNGGMAMARNVENANGWRGRQ